MNKLLLLLCIVIMSCEPSKNSAAGKAALGESRSSSDSSIAVWKDLPTCLQQKIDSFKLLDKSEQPMKVIEYEYKGKKVYYVAQHCCDFFNELYDSNCNLLGHPDGGFTGRGDGNFPEFSKNISKEKVIWEKKE